MHIQPEVPMKHIFIFSIFLLGFSFAQARPTAHPVPGHGTPDETPPAEEAVCDHYGGRLWGLCVAYCEAQDCDQPDQYAKESCWVLRDKLMDLVGSTQFPCDTGDDGGDGGDGGNNGGSES